MADGGAHTGRLGRRGRRLAAAGALALAVLAGGVWLSRAPNRARGRPTSSSSPGAFGTTPAGAVDGNHYGFLGFHSRGQGKEWWAVDLERPHALGRVIVYGRATCCFEQSVPLVLDVSLDGKSYRELARRNDPFSQFDPWAVSLKDVEARFVRLRTLRDTHLVLGEVDVFGRPR